MLGSDRRHAEPVQTGGTSVLADGLGIRFVRTI